MGYYSFNRPRRDDKLSWPCWLTDSGRFIHKVVKQSSISLAQDRESSPAGTDVLTTTPHHQLDLILTHTGVVDTRYRIGCGVGKRVRSMSLYQSRQCGIVFKQRSDHMDVCFIMHDCSRKLRKQY